MECKRMALTLVLGLGLALILSFVVLTSQAAPTTVPPSTATETGVVLSPATQAGSGEASTVVTYTLQLTNQTGAVDSFNLAIQPGNAWTTTLSLTETGTLTVGESLSFTVGVEIPASAAPEEQDRVMIVATSATSPTVYSGTARITTTAVRGLVPIYLPFVARAWPPVPEASVLDPIEVEGRGGYSLHWSSVALAGSYVLEEASRPDWGDAQVAYQGPGTSLMVTDPPPGSSFYRVQALNGEWASEWSGVQFIFHDHFGDPASGWEVVDDDYVRTEYVNGEYRILSKEAGYYYLLRAPTYERQNYAVEVDARWEGTPGSSYGLVFGVTRDFGQYYLFEVNTDFRRYRLLRRDPSGFVTVVPASEASSLNGGMASNRLKVVRNGAQITLEVNGTPLGTWSDGTIGGLTGAGLVSSPYNDIPSSDARFDNFSVVSSDGSQATMLQDFDGGMRRSGAGRDRQPVNTGR